MQIRIHLGQVRHCLGLIKYNEREREVLKIQLNYMLKSNLTLLLTKFLNHQNKLATVASQVNMFFGGRRICKRLRNQKAQT